MFLDPKVIITGWQEYYFLFVIVDPVSKSVHCMVEELSFVQSDDGVPEHLDRNVPNPELSTSSHLPLLPDMDPVSSPRVETHKGQLFPPLPPLYLLQNILS